jgi:NhaP-type Na+/H+ or K+/H+ antiporter
MKRHLNKQFATAFFGSLGTIAAAMVVQAMIAGDFQKIVQFRGVGEEMIFTLFVLMIGAICLGLTVSTIAEKD